MFTEHRTKNVQTSVTGIVFMLIMICASPGLVTAQDILDGHSGAVTGIAGGLAAAVDSPRRRDAFSFGTSIDASPTTTPPVSEPEDRYSDQLSSFSNYPGVTRGAKEGDLWRLEWDNDAFVHTDNGYTNGWSLQRHSRAHESWSTMELSSLSRWVSRTIPGLGDAGERVTKRGSGLTHVMMTPEDISNPLMQPDDVPFAGALGWAESWYAYDNRSLSAFQVYAGILGPYSGAEALQIQIHDWINADQPNGWDNQLGTEPLLNLNYAYKHKLLAGGEYRDRFAGDLTGGGQAGLGNFSTFAEFSLEARFGWNLPRGFAHLADPPGRGIMLDPTEGDPGALQVYFSVVARVSATAYTVFLDGNALGESPHPGIPYDTVSRGAVFGAHVAKGQYSIHLFLNSYNEVPFESVNPISDMTWGNLTFEYRF